MTPNGDRLFVEVRASAAGKEVCGIHTEELFEDYEDGVSVETIASTVAGEVLNCLLYTSAFIKGVLFVSRGFYNHMR